MDRRLFLKGLVATVAIASTAPLLLPRIIGDGVHDDWAGLQAALNGQPYFDPFGLVRVDGDTLHVGPGVYRLTGTLVNRSALSLVGAGQNKIESELVLDSEDNEIYRVYKPYPRMMCNVILRHSIDRKNPTQCSITFHDWEFPDVGETTKAYVGNMGGADRSYHYG